MATICISTSTRRRLEAITPGTALPATRILIACLLATPATAWEASRQGPVCLLTHETEGAEITVSHDIRDPVPYAIELIRHAAWQSSPVFAIRFDGPGRRTITTEAHQLTRDRKALIVTDTGFGNVLEGLAFNHVAIAVTGDTAIVIPLAGAAPEVERFRACAANLGA